MRYTLLLLIVSLVVPAVGQEKKASEEPKQKKTPKHKIAFVTAETAGPDFQVQGEYVGKINDELSLGLQVVALGDGKFDGYGYHGGLPGAGWNGETRVKASGQTQGDVTVLEAEGGTAEIKDGAVTIYNRDGNKVAELLKTIRKSPTLGQKAPAGAMVLFNGKSADNFEKGRLVKGMLQQGMQSKARFGSFKLHMEFMLSFMPYARGQQRSNSGCYMQGRYETQILDSFGLTGEHNECGGIYEIAKPKVNMCLPPLSWQTYDIEFHAAAFDPEGKKTKNARITVRHNGVLVHDNVEVPRATRAARMKESPEDGPLYVQDHGNPVRFRNIWVQPIKPKG